MTISIRVSAEQKEMLDEIAKSERLPVSQKDFNAAPKRAAARQNEAATGSAFTSLRLNYLAGMSRPSSLHS